MLSAIKSPQLDAQDQAAVLMDKIRNTRVLEAKIFMMFKEQIMQKAAEVRVLPVEKGPILGSFTSQADRGARLKEKLVLMGRRAKSGDKVSQFYLGYIYTRGIEGMIAPNREYSTFCLKNAAEQGYVPALCLLGFQYEQVGEIQKSLDSFYKAALNGSNIAKLRIGLHNLKGIKDSKGNVIATEKYAKGWRYVKEVAINGNTLAIKLLAVANKFTVHEDNP